MAQQPREFSVWKTFTTTQQTQFILFWVLTIAALTGFLSAWTPDTDIRRFTDPEHPDFWRSPAYRGDSEG